MNTRKFAAVALGAVTIAALVTGCGTKDSQQAVVNPTIVNPPASSSAPDQYSRSTGVLAPTDTGIGRNGAEVTILSVNDEQTSYGPATVFTFQIYNKGQQTISPGDWTYPTVVYGPAGISAEWFVSTADHLGEGTQGAMPPGARQTIREGYKVSKAQLTETVVTEGSLVWQGDFSTFTR